MPGKIIMKHTIHQGYDLQLMYDLQGTYPYKRTEALKEISRSAIEVAEKIKKHYEGPITMVSAPRTSKGKEQDNVATLLATILKLRNEGKNVFNQLPIIRSIDLTVESNHNAFTKAHRHDPFKELFASGLIKSIKYVHDWHISSGCRWEYEAAEKYGIKREILPKDFLNEEDYSKLERFMAHHR